MAERVPLRQAQGERIREAPYDGGRELPLRRGVGDAWRAGTPRSAPLWIPAFAGMTMGVWGSARAGGYGVRVPLSRDGRFANRPYDGVWGCRGCDGGLWWGCLAPLGSCLRRNVARGRPPSSALRTGFDRLRANGFARRPCDGGWAFVGLRANGIANCPYDGGPFDRLRANGGGRFGNCPCDVAGKWRGRQMAGARCFGRG